MNMQEEGLAEMIINTVNLDDIVGFHFPFVYKIMQKKEFEPEDRMIILSSLSIFLAIAYYDSTRLESLLGMKIPDSEVTFQTFLQDGVFSSQHKQIRLYYAHHYYLFCRIA